MKRYLLLWGGWIYKILSALKITTPTVIMLVDGGICSQMRQFLMGLYLKKRGLPVEYNVVWYNVDGRDANGHSVRNFDLLKVFPHIDFPVASSRKCKWYNRFFPYYGYSHKDFHKEWWKVEPPTTILGYFAPPAEVWQPFKEVFIFTPQKVLDVRNLAIYNSIPLQGSVAVHVRRGDLSSWRPLYGHPVTESYFLRAISYIQERVSDARFYFFSDDTAYVRDTLIPSVPFDMDYQVIDNDDAHGYMDLLLISRCQHQITSKGTLGKFGAMLGSQPEKIVVVEKDDENIDILQGLDFSFVRL